MKRVVKYLVALLIVLVCVYGFWLWLQYKWASVIKQTTQAIITELQPIDSFVTVSKIYTKTIEGEQALSTLTTSIGIEEILASALFQDKMTLEVQWIVDAGYIIGDITENDIIVTQDGTVTLMLGEAQILWITLTWTTQANILGIRTAKDIAMETTLREEAGKLILQEASEQGILDEAVRKAKALLQDIFLKANIQIKEVIVQQLPIQK